MEDTVIDKTECPNCSNSYSGNFCSNCGQRADIKALSVNDTLAQIPKSVFFIEARFQRLLLDFFKNPGGTIKAFSKGKRKKYGSPIQYFYFFASIEFILGRIYYSLLNSENGSQSEATEDYGIFSRFANATNLAEKIDDSIYASLTTPIFIGLVIAWYLRKTLNLAESIAYAFVYYSIVELYLILDNLFLYVNHFFELDFSIDPLFIPEALFLGFLFSRTIKGIKLVQFIKGVFAFYLSLLFIFLSGLILITLYVYIQ